MELKLRGLLAPCSRSTGELQWLEYRMCGKEEQDPSQGPRRSCKRAKTSVLGFGESATDLNGSVTVRCAFLNDL